jgi:hypothetical protein
MPSCLEGNFESDVPTPKLFGRFQAADSDLCGKRRLPSRLPVVERCGATHYLRTVRLVYIG